MDLQGTKQHTLPYGHLHGPFLERAHFVHPPSSHIITGWSHPQKKLPFMSGAGAWAF